MTGGYCPYMCHCLPLYIYNFIFFYLYMSAINWDKIAKELEQSDSESTDKEESPRILMR